VIASQHHGHAGSRGSRTDSDPLIQRGRPSSPQQNMAEWGTAAAQIGSQHRKTPAVLFSNKCSVS